jgi:ABC-type multidrug transport system fused ATPase/permease subunit
MIVGLLIYQLGPSALYGIIVVVILTPLQEKLLSKVQAVRREGTQWTDKRLKLTNEILQGVKVLKVYAWENPFTEKIQELRENEVYHIRKAAFIKSASNILMLTSPTMMTMLVFLGLASSANGIGTPATIFAGLVYLNVLRFPLMQMPHGLSLLADARVAIERIGEFMMAPELDSTPARVDLPADAVAAAQIPAVEICDATFRWETNPEEKETEGKGKDKGKGKGSKDKTAQDSDKEQVTPHLPQWVVNDVLTDINLRIPRGSLTVIVGAVGAGKSSLLAGLLGEINRPRGSVQLCGRVGYCSQSAWFECLTVVDSYCCRLLRIRVSHPTRTM